MPRLAHRSFVSVSVGQNVSMSGIGDGGARRSEAAVYGLVHEDFATTQQRGSRLEMHTQIEDSKFGRMQGARRSEAAVYGLVHEDFATTQQRGSRLEMRILVRVANLRRLENSPSSCIREAEIPV